jgi:class 3 adenylate cyclase
MNKRAKILVVDDEKMNVELLEAILSGQYDVMVAYDGEEAFEKVNDTLPDLILLDVMMPGLNGYEVCKRLKQKKETSIIPVIIVTALKEKEERIKGLEIGADDFLTKPIDRVELLARVKSLLRIKFLYNELTEINENLEQRVKEQVERIQKLTRLKQYFSPKLAEQLLSDEDIYKVRRKNLTIFFTDIRNFTSLSEMMEPEELFTMLDKYFTKMTEVVFEQGGIIGKFIGDGIMGFFGDPGEYNHAELTVKTALEMQSKIKILNDQESASWGGFPISIGIGINTGYVTIGNIGPENHRDYTVIGRAVNLASRIGNEANSGQILISQKTYNIVANIIEAKEWGNITVKGFDRPILVYSVLGLKK